jgi:hypothetical protein
MSARRTDVFFYGLFMDRDLLRGKGLAPRDSELASVSDYALRIGERATMVRQPSARVYGVVMSLTLPELERLYSDPGVRAYRPEPVMAELAGGGAIAALCYTLAEPPPPSERNPEYAAKLRALGQKLGLPVEYLSALQ